MNLDKGGNSSYRAIVKATTIFGGVQVFQIVLSLIRAKAVAVLLGTTGMGLNALFLNTQKLIGDITSLGLGQSAIKHIAQAEARHINDLKVVITSFRTLIWFTAGLGTLVTFVFSHYLSILVFGGPEYGGSFKLLSVVFLIGAITASTNTILQGLRKIKWLAMSTVIGSSIALAISLMIYYRYGIDGVVPAIIASALITMLLSRYYSLKLENYSIKLNFSEIWIHGKEMIYLGVVLASVTFMASLSTFTLNTFIARMGSLADLGLYNAGMGITAGYTSMIFQAMTKDYFPRVSAAVTGKTEEWMQLVREQSHFIALVITPILLILLTTLPLVINILLSKAFLPVIEIIPFLMLGIYIQGPTWAMGVVIIAMGDKSLQFKSEFLGNLIFITLGITGYSLFGFVGLGYGFLISKIIGLLITYFIVKFKYKFRYRFEELSILIGGLSLCIIMVVIQIIMGYPYTTYLGIPVLLFATVYSWVELNKKIDIKQIIRGISSRNGS